MKPDLIRLSSLNSMVGTDASEFSAKCDLGTAAWFGGICIWVVIVSFKYVKISFGKGEDAIFKRK